MGNSAMDISCELSHRGVAARLVVSTRRGAHVIPKYLFGRPLDALIRTRALAALMPQRMFGSLLIRLAVGTDGKLWSAATPSTRIWQTHPTVSSEFLIRAGSGDITVKPNIARAGRQSGAFQGRQRRGVRRDHLRHRLQDHAFRFSIPSLVQADNNDFPLFKRAFKPGIDNLIFVGFAQAMPSIIKFVEIQTRWLAAYLGGEYALPPADEMQRIMADDQRRANAGFVSTKRHTMQVDNYLYQWDLNKEWKRGARRAKSGAGAGQRRSGDAHEPCRHRRGQRHRTPTGDAAGPARTPGAGDRHRPASGLAASAAEDELAVWLRRHFRATTSRSARLGPMRLRLAQERFGSLDA